MKIRLPDCLRNRLSMMGLSLLVAVVAMGDAPASAERTQRVAREIPAADLRRLENLRTFAPGNLAELNVRISPEEVEMLTRQILAVDNLSIGSRKVGPDGRSPIHLWLEEQMAELAGAGWESLGTLRGVVQAPVSLDRLAAEAGREIPPSQLTWSMGGTEELSWDLVPMWPTGPMPSLTPSKGLRGPLVDVGAGQWEELRGEALNGAVVLMDFRGGRNWERLFSLGAQAVIVVEDDWITRGEAERLFCNTPVPFPRFYVDRQTGREIRAALALSSGGAPAVEIRGGNRYAARPVETQFYYLPPGDPRHLTVRSGELWERLAVENGVPVGELRPLNADLPADPPSGSEIRLPGDRGSLVLPPGALLQRIATDYGLRPEEIQAFNNLESAELVPGQKLVIPPSNETLVVFAPIDSVSVAPDAPHGAQVAGNLASVLLAVRHLAKAEEGHRRRGLLLVFIDGDSLGGQASRLFTEVLLQQEGRWQGGRGKETSLAIAQYRAAENWLRTRAEGGPAAPLSPADAQWFVREWLGVELEKSRVALAEERIRFLRRLQQSEAETDEADLRASLLETEAKLERMNQLRATTLNNGLLPWMERIESFANGVEEAGWEDFNLRSLGRRLREEMIEEETRRANAENNAATMARLLPLWRTAPGRATLGWYLDLSDGSATTGLKLAPSFEFRTSPIIGTDATRQLSGRLRRLFALAGSRGGWEIAVPFYAEEDAADFPVQGYEAVPYYPEFWASGNIASLPVGTLNDSLPRLDTPHDIPRYTNFANLAAQARHATFLLQLSLESILDVPAPNSPARPGFGRLTGNTVRFNVRSGIDPREPVPGASVYYPAVPQRPHPEHNTAVFRGARRGLLVSSLLNGSYELPLETISFNTTNGGKVFAYGLDEEGGFFRQITDMGQVGTRRRTADFRLQEGRNAEKRLVMTEVYPLVFFPGTDPMDYSTVGEARQRQVFRVIDAVLNGEPRHFALVNPSVDFREAGVDSNTLYFPPGRRARITVQRGMFFKMLLTGPITPEFPKGAGFVIGPGPDGQRNISLPLTPLHIARDMQAHARERQRIYERFGIRDLSVNSALDRSAEKIAEAEEEFAELAWRQGMGSAREAWGMLVKFYPRILTLGRDAVFSVIVLMALLVPGCVFLEKLFIEAKTILGQLAGAAALFLAATIFLRFFHPAFLISVSPFIVIIAFTMILMALIVLAICYQRFEVILRRARQQGGEHEGEAISLLSSLGTALSLGVANLKKRMSRTVLTAFTVTTLTFSVVAFVSVSGQDQANFRPLPLESEIEGRAVDPLPPAFDGLVFREFYWQRLPDQFRNALDTDFGARFEVVTRGHYLQVEGGSGADREGVNQISVEFNGRTVIVTGLMGFEPAEKRFSALHEAVSGGEWFVETDPEAGVAGDRFSLILPDNLAAELGISPEDILGPDGSRRPDGELPVVRMMNRDWQVIGILDVEQADRKRDITGKSLSMVDYVRSAFSANVAGELANENQSYHMSWRRLALVPMAVAAEVGILPRSVAVRFDGEVDREEVFRDIALRMNRTFFGSTENGVALITTQQKISLGGLAKILVPVILCVLIVTNTMLGTVEERKGEVGMLGAIGLSPGQISFLLLSESLVFSIIGIIAGTFAGLVFANLVPWISSLTGGFLGSLSFNFTSVISMLLAMGTGLVVLLATLIPARKAAALAAPSGMAKWELPAPDADGRIVFSLPFTLTRGNAVGMIAFFRRFLLNHTEPTSADFNCRDIAPAEEKGGEPALVLSADLWLAPYDLDVAQQFSLRMVPTDTPGVFGVVLTIERTSGTEEAWLRTNYGFLDLVRRQFLLWRHLPEEEREKFIAEGVGLFRPTATGPATVPLVS